MHFYFPSSNFLVFSFRCLCWMQHLALFQLARKLFLLLLFLRRKMFHVSVSNSVFGRQYYTHNRVHVHRTKTRGTLIFFFVFYVIHDNFFNIFINTRTWWWTCKAEIFSKNLILNNCQTWVVIDSFSLSFYVTGHFITHVVAPYHSYSSCSIIIDWGAVDTNDVQSRCRDCIAKDNSSVTPHNRDLQKMYAFFYVIY
jgi:hypothetical protein